jgi:hypothetical protein
VGWAYRNDSEPPIVFAFFFVSRPQATDLGSLLLPTACERETKSRPRRRAVAPHSV